MALLPACGLQLEKFSEGVMLSLGATNPAILLNQDQMWSWGHQQSAALVGVPDIPDDAEFIIDHLNNLISEDEIDFIFFMSPIPSEFITLVANELGTLNSKLIMLIPHEYPVSYPLRLDSRLFLYKIYGGSITLFEKYYIRLDKNRIFLVLCYKKTLSGVDH